MVYRLWLCGRFAVLYYGVLWVSIWCLLRLFFFGVCFSCWGWLGIVAVGCGLGVGLSCLCSFWMMIGSLDLVCFVVAGVSCWLVVVVCECVGLLVLFACYRLLLAIMCGVWVAGFASWFLFLSWWFGALYLWFVGCLFWTRFGFGLTFLACWYLGCLLFAACWLVVWFWCLSCLVLRLRCTCL